MLGNGNRCGLLEHWNLLLRVDSLSNPRKNGREVARVLTREHQLHTEKLFCITNGQQGVEGDGLLMYHYRVYFYQVWIFSGQCHTEETHELFSTSSVQHTCTGR